MSVALRPRPTFGFGSLCPITSLSGLDAGIVGPSNPVVEFGTQANWDGDLEDIPFADKIQPMFLEPPSQWMVVGWTGLLAQLCHPFAVVIGLGHGQSTLAPCRSS